MSRRGVIITGGARRVGAALVRHFAANGYDVALHYHTSEAEAKKLQAELEKKGKNILLFSHDLFGISGIPSLINDIHQAMPHTSVLVNNASVFERATMMETDEALFDRQMDMNFKAPFFLTQAFAQAFGKGSVINMLDTSITRTEGSHFVYLLAKKALGEFTRMAARELGPDIRVNGVCPGIVLPSNELDENYMVRREKQLPLRKVASLEQVAAAARWLCEADVTGQTVFVDGGEHVL